MRTFDWREIDSYQRNVGGVQPEKDEGTISVSCVYSTTNIREIRQQDVNISTSIRLLRNGGQLRSHAPLRPTNRVHSCQARFC